MYKWFALLALACAVLLAPGCGSGRPDPEDNPDFRPQSAEDPMQADLPPPPGQ